jgi:hypothetical protein
MEEIRCKKCKKNLPSTKFNNKKGGGITVNCTECLDKMKIIRKNNKGKSGNCITCTKEKKIKTASFGLVKDGIKLYCSDHKSEDSVNLTLFRIACLECKNDGKITSATYGHPNGKRISCFPHRKDGMIKLIKRTKGLCEKCKTTASFGYKKDNKKIRCSSHKESDMIDLIRIKFICYDCEKENKISIAMYGFLSDKRATKCKDHKLEGMISLKHRNENCITCQKEGIFYIGCFGFSDSNSKERFCSSHKEKGMINLGKINTYCEKCKTTANFGFLKDGKKVRCSIHKEEGMINLKAKMCVICEKNNDPRQACFGFEKDGKTTRCSKHKEEGMIDIIHKSSYCVVCAQNNVEKSSCYGLFYEKKNKCAVHKSPNELRNNRPKCEECDEMPVYGDEKMDEIPKRCEEHKKPVDYNMAQRKCVLCQDFYFIPSGEDKCRGCLGFEVEKQVKIKEKKVNNLLTSMIPKIGEFVTDTMIFSGCSKKRPDFYYPKFNDCFSLIVECDEYQHSKYSCGIQGELIRMIDIYEQGSCGFPLIFVRFNPDSYYYENKIIKNYKGREGVLEKVILDLKNKISIDFPIGVIYLFYDNFKEFDIKIEPLTYCSEKNFIKIKHKHPLSLQEEYEHNF